MSAEALVILNPAAGRGRARALWNRLSPEKIPGSPPFRVHETSGPGDAVRRAAAWAAAGENGAIIVLGGDGTIHEVVNGLDQAGRSVPIAILRAGTGNDFAENAGLPEAPEQTLAALARGLERPADLGALAFRDGETGKNRRVVFVNSASVGVSPAANRHARTIGKILPGRLRYRLGGVWALLTAPRREFRIARNGHVFTARPLNITLANGAGFGGGMRISPGSSVHDGSLDQVVIGELGLLRSLLALARLSRGAHVRMAGVTVTPVTDPVTISADGAPIEVEADGHDYRASGEITITPAPNAIRLIAG